MNVVKGNHVRTITAMMFITINVFQGINRPKFASDAVGAVLRELRLAATDKK